LASDLPKFKAVGLLGSIIAVALIVHEFEDESLGDVISFDIIKAN
jgi:hypothetical protein